MRDETEKALRNILNCFTGEDGGVRFVNFRATMESVDNQAKEGNKASDELVKIMTRFSKLIDIFNEEYNQNNENTSGG